MGHTTDHILETLGALHTGRGAGPAAREVDRETFARVAAALKMPTIQSSPPAAPG